MSGNQLFRSVPDHRVLFSYLDEVCVRNTEFFVIDDVTYKRMKYDDRIFALYKYLIPFYHIAKQKYVLASATQAGFLTILRQLCRLFSLQYTTKVVYKGGKHHGCMTIYLPRHKWNEELPEPTTVTITRGKQSNDDSVEADNTEMSSI